MAMQTLAINNPASTTRVGPTGWQGGQIDPGLKKSTGEMAQRSQEQQLLSMKLQADSIAQARQLRDSALDRQFQMEQQANQQGFAERFQKMQYGREDFLFGRNQKVVEDENTKRKAELESWQEYQDFLDETGMSLILNTMQMSKDNDAARTQMQNKIEERLADYGRQTDVYLKQRETAGREIGAGYKDVETKEYTDVPTPVEAPSIEKDLVEAGFLHAANPESSVPEERPAMTDVIRKDLEGPVDAMIRRTTGGRMTLGIAVGMNSADMLQAMKDGDIGTQDIMTAKAYIDALKTQLGTVNSTNEAFNTRRDVLLRKMNDFDITVAGAIAAGKGDTAQYAAGLKQATDAYSQRGMMSLLKEMNETIGLGNNAVDTGTGALMESIRSRRDKFSKGLDGRPRIGANPDFEGLANQFQQTTGPQTVEGAPGATGYTYKVPQEPRKRLDIKQMQEAMGQTKMRKRR
jgi:hypothetical protein